MKWFLFPGLLVLSACMRLPTATPQPNPGLPALACSVADFTSDTGDADFITGNRAKTFAIFSTADGFIVETRSDVFSPSTTDFAVVGVTDSQISAVRRNQTRDSSLNFSLIADRAAVNGTRRVVQTMQVQSSLRPQGYTQNQWTLACRDAG